MGPLQDPVTLYGINYAGTQISKQSKVGLDWYEFLCFESPTVLFASQHNLFRTMWPDRASNDGKAVDANRKINWKVCTIRYRQQVTPTALYSPNTP